MLCTCPSFTLWYVLGLVLAKWLQPCQGQIRYCQQISNDFVLIWKAYLRLIINGCPRLTIQYEVFPRSHLHCFHTCWNWLCFLPLFCPKWFVVAAITFALISEGEMVQREVFGMPWTKAWLFEQLLFASIMLQLMLSKACRIITKGVMFSKEYFPGLIPQMNIRYSFSNGRMPVLKLWDLYASTHERSRHSDGLDKYGCSG